MEHFVINCPWCRDDSRFEVDDLSKACVPPIYATDDADSVLDEVEKRYPVFQCLQHDCLAPFEALICRGLRTAKTVQQAASRVAWTPPRRFRLRKTAHGELYQDVYGVLFNRKPLTRWKEIRLSSLLEVPIIAKFLSAHAWRFGSPVTLFEAWASDFEDKIYWIPVQPMGPPASPGPVRIGTSPQYRETCRVCRNVFEQAAIDALRFSSRLKRNCPSFDDCPAQRACLSEPWAQPNISDRCLRWLELRELDNPCWQSDLKIIGDMVTKFEKEKVWATKPFAPHEATCWAGYMEMAFPVIVHDHLAGALMIGQFGKRSRALCCAADAAQGCVPDGAGKPHPLHRIHERQQGGNLRQKRIGQNRRYLFVAETAGIADQLAHIHAQGRRQPLQRAAVSGSPCRFRFSKYRCAAPACGRRVGAGSGGAPCGFRAPARQPAARPRPKPTGRGRPPVAGPAAQAPRCRGACGIFCKGSWWCGIEPSCSNRNARLRVFPRSPGW